MKAADFVSEYKISRFLDMCIEKSNRAGSTGRRGFVPTGGKLPRTKRLPTPVEICPLKAVCR